MTERYAITIGPSIDTEWAFPTLEPAIRRARDHARNAPEKPVFITIHDGWDYERIVATIYKSVDGKIRVERRGVNRRVSKPNTALWRG